MVLEDLIKSMPNRNGSKPLYRLRWKFVYSDGKPPKIGAWNSGEQMAWAIPKENLRMAIIEGEHQINWITKTLLEVDGHDYASCMWVGGVNAGGWGFGTKNYSPNIIGLTLMSSTHAATIFIDGTGSCEPLSEYDKKFKLREHTIGG